MVVGRGDTRQPLPSAGFRAFAVQTGDSNLKSKSPGNINLINILESRSRPPANIPKYVPGRTRTAREISRSRPDLAGS